MRAVIRRLRRLEERLTPAADYESPAWMEILRERRQRRADASGLPYEEFRREPILDEHGRRPATWAEVLRLHRARRCAEVQRAEKAGAKTTVSDEWYNSQ